MSPSDRSRHLQTFGDRLIDAVREAGGPVKQKPLSEWFRKNYGIEVSAPMISKYKNKDTAPRIDQCRSYATALGVCVEWLLTGRGARYPEDGPISEMEGRILALWRKWTPTVKRYVFSQMEATHYTRDLIERRGTHVDTDEEVADYIRDAVSETGEFYKLANGSEDDQK